MKTSTSASKLKPVTSEVVFRSTLDILFSWAIKGQMTPRLHERLVALGIDDTALPMQLERSTWNAMLRTVCEEIHPQLAPAEAHFALGRAMSLGMAGTLRGKAQATMARMLGPKRVLEHFRANLSTGSSYSAGRLEVMEDGRLQFWVNETGEQHPSFFSGLLSAGLELAGVKFPRVDLLGVDARGARYAVSWDE